MNLDTELLLQRTLDSDKPASQFIAFDQLASSVKRTTHTTLFSYSSNNRDMKFSKEQIDKLEKVNIDNIAYSLNCDASMYGVNDFEIPISPNLPNSIIAGVIKYHNEDFFYFRKSVICRDNNMAELLAINEGLDIVASLGIKDLNIYTDSSVSINFIKKHFSSHEEYLRKEKFLPFTQKILDSLQHFDNCNFIHVPRKLNKLADKITKHKTFLLR